MICDFDNFLAWVPTSDAVLHAGRSTELRHDGDFRANADGSGYGPLIPDGDLIRLPPSGLEARPVEIFVKVSRGDLDQLPDIAIDDLRVQILHRASWLFVPGEAPGS